jgi:hypothetical protein
MSANNSVPSSDLRQMVREVLRDVMAARKPAHGETSAERVRIASDADLAAFVRRLITGLADPVEGARIREGKHRFSLDAAPGAPANDVARGAGLSGVITEARVLRAAGSGALVLAADAVLTPLARDKARSLGLKIERRR